MHIIEIGSYGNFEYGVNQGTLELYRRHTDSCCRLKYTNGSTEWHVSEHMPNLLKGKYYNLCNYIEEHGYDK
ncbi:hypothetical protein HYZ41_00900 [archaeon]|nr:hypothetical protein [archaeon]